MDEIAGYEIRIDDGKPLDLAMAPERIAIRAYYASGNRTVWMPIIQSQEVNLLADNDGELLIDG